MISTTSCQKTCSKRGFESFSKLRIKKRNFQLCYKHWMHCRETDFLFVRRQNDGGEKSLRAAINFGGEQCVPALGNSCLAVAAFEICALCFFSGGEGACGVFWPEWVLLHNWGVGWLTSSGPRAWVGCPCQVRFGSVSWHERPCYSHFHWYWTPDAEISRGCPNIDEIFLSYGYHKCSWGNVLKWVYLIHILLLVAMS